MEHKTELRYANCLVTTQLEKGMRVRLSITDGL